MLTGIFFIYFRNTIYPLPLSAYIFWRRKISKNFTFQNTKNQPRQIAFKAFKACCKCMARIEGGGWPYSIYIYKYIYMIRTNLNACPKLCNEISYFFFSICIKVTPNSETKKPQKSSLFPLSFSFAFSVFFFAFFPTHTFLGNANFCLVAVRASVWLWWLVVGRWRRVLQHNVNYSFVYASSLCFN